MKPLYFDSVDPATGEPYTWDTPNLTFDGILEPGDPGYVPISAPSTETKPKLKKMKRQPFYPSRAAEQLVWLENFRNKLAGHAATLGISVTACAAGIADARWIIYVLGSWLPAARAWSMACTDAAAEAQSPAGATLMDLPTFTPPALPAAVGGNPAVVPVNTGALDRIFALVQTMKENGAFTETIGSDLGVIGSQHTGPDLTAVQPEFTVQAIGSHLFIDWGWGGNGAFLDQCEIQVDRGTGWTLLTYDSTPGYTDSAAHPATPTKWKYRAIYHVGDAQVGIWSATVEITVGG